jgi:site-specific DNA-methyltransferase (adenine-specific)
MLEENKIHLGDCLDLMPSIPSKSVDMILCDLPYGTTACEWDSIIDMSKLWQEYERVIKDNGAIVLTASSYFTFKLWQSNIRLFRYKIVWNKRLKVGLFDATRRPMRQHEDILIFYKKSPCYNPQMTLSDTAYSMKAGQKVHPKFQKDPIFTQEKKDVKTRYPSDIIQIDSANLTRERGLHPTQKPVALFEYLIKTYTNENELVLDNCSGSGTTAIACMNTNRRFICIERDETYHRKSIERLANHEPLLHMGDKC